MRKEENQELLQKKARKERRPFEPQEVIQTVQTFQKSLERWTMDTTLIRWLIEAEHTIRKLTATVWRSF